jgi:hypothetical protein
METNNSMTYNVTKSLVRCIRSLNDI